MLSSTVLCHAIPILSDADSEELDEELVEEVVEELEVEGELRGKRASDSIMIPAIQRRIQ